MYKKTKCEKGASNSKNRNAKEDIKIYNTKRKGRRTADKPAEFNASTATNDPSWYAMTPELMKDAGRIPFSWSVGNLFRTENPIFKDYAVPGICSIKLMPTYGVAENKTDPINMASFETYSFVRHANSGHANYDAPDLMLYVLAVSNVVSYIEFLRRLYGVVNVYSQRNRYMPEGLVRSMQVDFNDVLNHLADFRYGVNVLINKLASFAAPAEFTLFNRHAFLYSRVYTEGTSVKDQLYLYNPAGFGRYVLTGSKFSDAPAGALMYLPFDPGVLDTIVIDQNTPCATNGKLFTVAQLLQYGNMLLKPLMESEDLNIMSGDILKAYGSDKIFKYALLDEAYQVVPSFDIAVLEQMKNAKTSRTAIFNSNTAGTKTEIYYPGTNTAVVSTETAWAPLLVYQELSGQNYGYLYSAIGYGYNPADKNAPTEIQIMNSERFITTTTAEVTPELIMETSRLVTAAVPEMESDVNANNKFVLCYVGSEVVTNIQIFQNVVDEHGALVTTCVSNEGSLTYYVEDKITNIQRLYNVIKRMGLYSAFDFVPEFGVYYTDTTAGTSSLLGYQFDLDNYAILSPTDVGRLHEAAILSMLHVNSIARV